MGRAEISKEPIRAEVTRLLLERLLSGELSPGARINESRLAEELGVSRTPLREALIRLQYEGFLENEKGKGFSVATLDPLKARQLYPLAGLLEGLALETTTEMPGSLLSELDEIERAREEAQEDRRIHEVVELDHRWHTRLVSRCPNTELLEILRVLKRRLFRYEYLLSAAEEASSDSHQHHSLILRALRDGNDALAVEQLKHHWQQGAEARYSLLAERELSESTRWTSLM